MILNPQHSHKYLQDYRDGKIPQGLGIDCDLDNHLRYKHGQFNMVNGLDNVGKTAWMMWYFLTLSVKHDIRWCVWLGENDPRAMMRTLIEFYTGERVKGMDDAKLLMIEQQLEHWFKFIDNNGFYKLEDMLKMFIDSEAQAFLIDPFTGLNRGFNHSDNYDFLNTCRAFCNEHNKTLYVNTHPNTEAARSMHPTDHALAGYQKPPHKSQSEGGQPFANRPDDFITIHRMVGHPQDKYTTEVYVRKVKYTETGGEPTAIDEPVRFYWNNGLGFTCNGVNPIKNEKKIESTLPVNKGFEEETPF